VLVDIHDLQRSTDQNVASTQNNKPNNQLRAAESVKKLTAVHPNTKLSPNTIESKDLSPRSQERTTGPPVYSISIRFISVLTFNSRLILQSSIFPFRIYNNSSLCFSHLRRTTCQDNLIVLGLVFVLKQEYTNPRDHVARPTRFSMVPPNICGPSTRCTNRHKLSRHLKTVDARMVTSSRFHTEDPPKVLGVTTTRRLVFVHPCFKLYIL
jgi:hypothetical protein